jgi:hypothetical protein
VDGSTRIILDKELAKLSIESLIRHVILKCYRRNMYKNTKIMMASAIAAVLTVSVLTAVFGTTQAYARISNSFNGGIGGAGGAGGVGGNGGVNVCRQAGCDFQRSGGQDASGGSANGGNGGDANGGSLRN